MCTGMAHRQSDIQIDVHVYTYIHTYIHTCVRYTSWLYIHTYIHTFIHSYIHTIQVHTTAGRNYFTRNRPSVRWSNSSHVTSSQTCRLLNLRPNGFPFEKFNHWVEILGWPVGRPNYNYRIKTILKNTCWDHSVRWSNSSHVTGSQTCRSLNLTTYSISLF